MERDHRVTSATEGTRSPARLNSSSSVLAIVPHHKCERWLADCLESLLEQSRPLDGIVVVDDGSGDPPSGIVRAYPSVTLLTTPDNGGPYRIAQEIINQTNYDAYLLQDADDWSSSLRLEQLLTAAAETGAELLGCQAHRVLLDESEVVPLTYPLDVNQALRDWPTWYALLHPTSLVSRDLNMRIGGYATGLKFGGDLEFLHRATYAARVINIPQFSYFKRVWSGALTSRPDTGLASPARKAFKEAESARARERAAQDERGEELDLRPMVTATPIALRHILGPALRPSERGSLRDDVANRISEGVGWGAVAAR